MGECVVKTIRTAKDVGIAQYQRFVNERVSDKTTDFNNTIRKITNYSCLAPAPVIQLIYRHLGWPVWKLMCNSSQRCTFHANQGRVIWMSFYARKPRMASLICIKLHCHTYYNWIRFDQLCSVNGSFRNKCPECWCKNHRWSWSGSQTRYQKNTYTSQNRPRLLWICVLALYWKYATIC